MDIPQEEDVKDVLAAFYADPVLMCREVLKDWFPKPMPWVHRGILALVLRKPEFLLNFGPEVWRDGQGAWTPEQLRKIERHFVYKGQPLFQIKWEGDTPVSIKAVVSDKNLCVMPRGFSKTTLFKAAILFFILFLERKFIVYLSETGMHAAAQLNDIRRELGSNDLIHALWGNLVPDRTDAEKWTEGEFETKTGVVCVARGRGGQVRGLNRKSRRPDVILFDDVEDLESVSTPEQRAKALEWMRSDVEHARSRVDSDTYFFGLGTILHNEAMIPTLMKDPAWLSFLFGAIDLDGDALWPDNMTLEKIAKEKESYAATGSLSGFYREILSTLVAPEDMKFKPEYIRYEPHLRGEFVAVAVACDPAISDKVGASHFTVAVVGMTANGLLVVCDVWGKRGVSPRDQIDKYFELKAKWKATVCGVEGIAYQSSLIHLMKEEMFRMSRLYGNEAFFEIVSITHSKAKHARIEGVLQPRYAAGYIVHQRHFGELEVALLDWPNGKMDYPDVVAMAVSLLDPFASLASSEDIMKDNMPDLEYEIGDWRIAP